MSRRVRQPAPLGAPACPSRPMRRLGALTAVAAVLAVSGCSLAPRYERPAAPVPAAWPTLPQDGSAPAASDAAGEGATAAADLPWQSFFVDERLKRLISAALDHNRDLRVALLNIERARAQYGVTRADQLPTINAAITGSRQQPNTGNNGQGVASTYTAGLGLSAFELDFFGRVRNLSEAALQQYLATEEARKTTQISLIADVAQSWLAWQAAAEQLQLARETLATRETSWRLARLQFDSGTASEIDLRLAESLVETARATVAQQQRAQAQAANALQLLCGVAPDAPPAAPGEPGSLYRGADVTRPVPVGLASSVLLRRPDVRQAEHQLIAANANIGAARAAFFPRITLTASGGVASSQLDRLFSDGTRAWSFAPQLVLPIFDAGRNQANLDIARANREIAVAQYERAIQSAFREVADALVARSTYAEQARAQQAQAEAEATRARLVDLRFRNGVASSLDVLDAQRSVFSAQQAAIQVRLAQRQNEIALYRALGGGWTEPGVSGDSSVSSASPSTGEPSQQ